MKEMSNEEAEYRNSYYTEHTVMPDLTKPGFFARKYGMTVTLDLETAKTLMTYAEATHKTPAEIIAAMVRKEISAAGQDVTVTR